MSAKTNETILVSKAQKVDGQRQTWAVYNRRPNVSATVWDEDTRCLRYYKASYACQVAADLNGDIVWRRSIGRGCANYYGTVRTAA